MKYIIVEVQVFEDGNVSTPCYAYDNRNSAESKYHSILSSAAVSSLPKHTCYLVSDDGYVFEGKCYEHEVELTEATE